ncbi:MAG TPA: succinate dehydrogenase cytochrome b subunit [Longimicrobiales bacterium]|nr:succinate dehydrogenase cytochrome b subunit [Longimicrobiales bacterium]
MATAAPARLTQTSIGKKWLMALSSTILFLYIVLHLVGNLKIFFGSDPFNHYAEWLRMAGSPMIPDEGVLWAFRVLLLIAIVVHIGAYVQLWLRTRKASGGRGRYREYRPQVFSYASRTMAWGGITILAFVIYHLLHMTFGTVHPGFIAADPYSNVVMGFESFWVSLFYMIGVIALGLHLYHGLWSATQTFGLNNPRYNRYRRPVALWTAALITAGYLSIPLAVLTGLVSR